MTWEPLRNPDESVRPVDDSLRNLHHRLGLARPDVLAEVERHWPALVGGPLARRSVPTAIRKGELTVSTADPATAEQLRWSAADLVSAVTAVVGEGMVRTVVVRIRPAPHLG